MDTDNTGDGELIARLKRLDACSAEVAPGFDYDGLLDRHAAGRVRARRRLAIARATAGALLVALIGVSFWRLGERAEAPKVAEVVPPPAAPARLPQPRIVRADTYLAVAALEDHIASVDDALNYARLRGAGGDVARLERARAELFTSYSQLRYAELVSANF